MALTHLGKWLAGVSSLHRNGSEHGAHKSFLVLLISLLEFSNKFKAIPVDGNLGVSQENFACIAQWIFCGHFPF